MFLTNSPVTWLIVLTWVVTIGNAIIPVVSPTWGAIIGSIVSIASLFIHNNQIKTGRVGKAF